MASQVDTSQVDTQSHQPPKFSRYRSVRKAAGANGFHTMAAAPPMPIDSNAGAAGTNNQNESIRRSMSRYRRAKPVKDSSSNPVPPLPTTTRLNRQPEHGDSQVETKRWSENYSGGKEYRLQNENEPTFPQPNRSSDLPRSPTRANRPLTSPRTNDPNQGTFPKASMDQARSGETSPRSPMKELYTTKIAERLYPRKSTINADDQQISGIDKHDSGPTSPTQQHMRPRDAAVLDINQTTHEERRAHELAMSKHNKPNTAKKIVKERGGFLSRIRTTMDSETDSRSRQETIKALRDKISPPQPVESKEPPKGPAGVDAPISAVNAGERKVLVTCNDSFINLPVTPTTQAKDILHSAANCLGENISPQTSIVQESFKQLGLQRPLRRYERIRDVMNSWDNDTQNHLVIVATPDDEVNDGLHVVSAPRKQPPDRSFHLYHSQRPGKWEKRWVTLRSDGQVTVAKKQGSESTNICHLSDFDIYSPTRREHKKLKPPKKMCFAVKSQQKLAMFLTTENFVHFFCTNDGDIGSVWHAAIQQWRSWYLINVLGAGDKQDEGAAQAATKEPPRDAAGATSKESREKSNPRGVSEATPYQVGSFKPLLDTDAVNGNERTMRADPSGETPATDRAMSSKRAVSVRYDKTRQPLASAPSSPKKTTFGADVKRRVRSKTTTSRKEANPEQEPFVETGLLGRAYTKRYNAMRNREKERDRELEENAPFAAQGLLGGNMQPGASSPTSRSFSDQLPRSGQHSSGPSSRENTVKGDNEMGSVQSKPTRQKPKPLVDLSPAYQEPPQHARKGRGITTEPGKPLVEGATGPELHPGAIVVPSATTWRKPSQQQPPPPPQRSGPASSSQVSETLPPATTTISRSTSRRQRSNTYRSGTSHRSPQSTTDPRYLQSLNTHTSSAAPLQTQPQPSATQDNSPFSPSGLLARSGTTTQGAGQTGRGIATGDRNQTGRPLLDMTQQSQFVDGSLLRSVEAQGPGENLIIDRERANS